MKKTFILLFLAITGTLAVFSQEEFFRVPDYKQIAQKTADTSSEFYYPKLLERYLNGDSTFTQEESRHLYFGYASQSAYVPTDTSSYNKKLADIIGKQSFTVQDYTNILQYANALLAEDPFNLRALNAKMLVYAQQNDIVQYKKTGWQRRIVQDAIVSTGDGTTDKTPFYVIKVAHEYDILPFLGYTFGGEDKIVRGKKVNYLSLGQNRFGVEKIYFDISPVIDYVSTRGGGKM